MSQLQYMLFFHISIYLGLQRLVSRKKKRSETALVFTLRILTYDAFFLLIMLSHISGIRYIHDKVYTRMPNLQYSTYGRFAIRNVYIRHEVLLFFHAAHAIATSLPRIRCPFSLPLCMPQSAIRHLHDRSYTTEYKYTRLVPPRDVGWLETPGVKQVETGEHRRHQASLYTPSTAVPAH